MQTSDVLAYRRAADDYVLRTRELVNDGPPVLGGWQRCAGLPFGCPPRHWRFLVSVTSKAIESIRAMIRSGELSPGERLPPEHELAERLGVSRGSLREARS